MALQPADERASLIADDVYEIIMQHRDRFDSEIIYDRDFDYDYFGFKTLERSYLLRLNDVIVERPQHMLMRVAIGIHKDNIEDALNTYKLMSERWFTHASPTLFNAGTPRPQLSSCFLVAMKEDSIDGIYDTLKECAVISKSAGGIGLHMHNIRSVGSARLLLVFEPYALRCLCSDLLHATACHCLTSNQPSHGRLSSTCSIDARHARLSPFPWHPQVHDQPPASPDTHTSLCRLHPRHQRHLQWHRADAARLQ